MASVGLSCGSYPCQAITRTEPANASLMTNPEAESEALTYQTKASMILAEIQANHQICGTAGGYEGNSAPNVDLALQYVDRCIELFPENPIYLNIKALLLWEGMGDRTSAMPLVTKAALLSPRDIDIQNNLKIIRDSPNVPRTRQTSLFGASDAMAGGVAAGAAVGLSEIAGGCFIASAAYGGYQDDSVIVLQWWRDSVLAKTHGGRMLISAYYKISPRIADWISTRESRKAIARVILKPIVLAAKRRKLKYERLHN